MQHPALLCNDLEDHVVEVRADGTDDNVDLVFADELPRLLRRDRHVRFDVLDDRDHLATIDPSRLVDLAHREQSPTLMGSAGAETLPVHAAATIAIAANNAAIRAPSTRRIIPPLALSAVLFRHSG